MIANAKYTGPHTNNTRTSVGNREIGGSGCLSSIDSDLKGEGKVQANVSEGIEGKNRAERSHFNKLPGVSSAFTIARIPPGHERLCAANTRPILLFCEKNVWSSISTRALIPSDLQRQFVNNRKEECWKITPRHYVIVGCRVLPLSSIPARKTRSRTFRK